MTKHLLITGANRGIGLALVKEYLALDWHVVACCRDPQSSEALTELLEQHSNLDIFELDVTDYQAVADLSESLNDLPLDLLINNAGYYGPKGYGFGDTNVEEWRKVLEVNTIAPLKLAEAFYAHLSGSSRPIIASMSSKVGSMEDNTSGGGYIYRSSKAGLNSVVKSLSNDLLPQGIISVALHPGWVLTEMGGPNALIDTHKSALGLIKVIAELDESKSGGFYDYLGKVIPW